MDGLFKDQIIIVTGASDGLGKAVAKRLINSGATILGIAKTMEKLEKVKRQLGLKFIIYQADLSDKKQLNDVYDKILNDYKSIDILVNNAAIWHEGTIEEHNLEVLHSLVMTNVFSVMGSVFKIYPGMKKQKKGQILNINSTAGIDICPDWAPYAGTKFAITGYTKGLYEEASKHGVKVMQIHPGGMNTNLFERFKKGYGVQDWMLDKNYVADFIIDMLSKPNDTVVDSLVIRKNGMI